MARKHNRRAKRRAPAAKAAVRARSHFAPYRPLTGAQDAEARREALLWIGGVWLVSRALLLMLGVFARAAFERTPVRFFHDFSAHAWLNIWGAWDSGWYVGIAEDGYHTEPQADGYANYAFFPLYPWLMRLTGWLFGEGGAYLGGLLVSNIALLAAAWLLYRWMEQEKDRATAKKAVLFLFLFPTGYVFSCLMTEGLFIALSLGAYYYARRGNWFLASLLGGLSAMTRSLGVLIAPLLAFEYLRQRYDARAPASAAPIFSPRGARHLLRALDFRCLWLALVPAGLGVFALVCWRVTGDPLAFISIQDIWIYGNTGGAAYKGVNPLDPLFEAFRRISVAPHLPHSQGYVYGALFSAAVFALLLAGCRQIGMPLLLWSLALLLVPLSSALHSPYSMPRYVAVIFPLFVIFAALSWRKWLFWATAAALALLQAATWMLWTLGRPFAV